MLSSACATVCKAVRSPLSLPKARWVTPRAWRIWTPPRAKDSAEDTAHWTGNSTTRSAPHRSAISARAYLLTMAASPRWVKGPLMAQTTGAPGRAALAWAMRWACPRWKGSNSAMIPMQVLSSIAVSSWLISILPENSQGIPYISTKKMIVLPCCSYYNKIVRLFTYYMTARRAASSKKIIR